MWNKCGFGGLFPKIITVADDIENQDRLPHNWYKFPLNGPVIAMGVIYYVGINRKDIILGVSV